jgi:hypothetical protein
MNTRSIQRRQFIKQATTAAAIGLVYPSARVLGANDRVRLGIIGPGARGQELMKDFLKAPMSNSPQPPTYTRGATKRPRTWRQARRLLPTIAGFWI